MRVLLVRPPVPRHTIGLKNIMACEPLELEYVAAGLPGHEVQILDLVVERGLDRRLRTFRPDVVGTSCYISGVNEAIRVCREARRWRPDVRTVVGGVHASCAPEDFADPCVDAIVLGDGTSIIADLVEAFARGQSLEEVPGLALPRPGGLVHTAARPYMPDPDSLPLPRRDLVSHLRGRYYYLFHRPVALVKTMWGCPYRCSFCVPWNVTGGRVFARSPESIVRELEAIDCEDVYIVDDIFLWQPDRLRRIGALLRERGVNKKFLAYSRADFLASHEEVVAEWAKLGLAAVLVGFEAPTDRELESMDKRCTAEMNRRAAEVLRRHGVDAYGSLIPQPDYGPADWERLWDFIDELGLYYVNISPLTPMPGTPDWERWRDRITVPRAAHGLWDLTHVVVPTKKPLREYYRSLRRLYVRTVLDPRRAARLPLRPRPAFWSPANLRLMWGAVQVWWQLRQAHTHHAPREIRRAMERGPALAPPAARETGS